MPLGKRGSFLAVWGTLNREEYLTWNMEIGLSSDSEYSFSLVKLEEEDYYVSVHNKKVANLYRSEESDEPIYVSSRIRSKGGGSSQFLQKHNSYAISTNIIQELRSNGVETICIIENHENAYLFDIKTYLNAEIVNYEEEQYAPDISEARNVFEGTVSSSSKKYPEELKF